MPKRRLADIPAPPEILFDSSIAQERGRCKQNESLPGMPGRDLTGAEPGSICRNNAAVVGVDGGDAVSLAEDDIPEAAALEHHLLERKSPLQTVAVGDTEDAALVLLIRRHEGYHF